jgi:hypothetical protein
MDQGSIFLYLNRNGLSAKVIHNELVQISGPDAMAYSTVTKTLRASHGTAQNEEWHSDPSDDVANRAILQALDQNPFTTVPKLAKATCIPTATVWRRLTRPLGFFVKHLRWVPHRSSDDQRKIRVDRSNELLRLLLSLQANDWQSLMTLNESWFYLSTSHEIVWLQADQEPPESVKHMIEDRKMMVTIVWNPQGFHLIDGLPNGQRFNASYYVDMIL